MTSDPADARPHEGEGVRFEKPGARRPAVEFQPARTPAPTPTYAEPAPAIGSGPPGPTYELASWGRRLAATLIDGAVIAAMLGVVGLVVWAWLSSASVDWQFDGHEANPDQDFVDAFVAILIASVCWLLISLTYAPIWMWRTNGRTLGKQLLGIRVVRADGIRMTYGFAVFREFLVKGLLGAIASSFTLYLYALADGLWPLWDSERRAIHDHIARTRVVRD